MKRILQSVCRPVRTTRWNNGTDRSFANRITFNNENGVHVHKISENHQSLNRVLDRAGEILCMPKKAKIALYVSPTEEYKTKQPLEIEIEIGENGITRGELALHCAKLIKCFYDGIRNEFGPKAPSFSEYPGLGHPVPFERMLLASVDCMEEEDEGTWQVVYAAD